METGQHDTRNDVLASLREQRRRSTGIGSVRQREIVSTGCVEMDRLLPRRGIQRGSLVEWLGENSRSLSVLVGLYQPSSSPQYLLELIGLQLEQKRFSQPVSGIIVEATVTAPLAWKQSELFDSDKRQDSQKLGSLIDRLSSRLGRAAVVRPQLRAEAVPERAWLDVPLSGKGRTRRDNRSRFAPFERPLTLLPTPLPVNVIVTVPEGLPVRLVIESTQHDIIRLWGPERIETAWWRGPSVQRDYYRVKTITGQRFWLFRRLQDGRWFLHGEFD